MQYKASIDSYWDIIKAEIYAWYQNGQPGF